MTSPYTIQQHIGKIENSPSHEDLLYNILAVYMELFPVSNSLLFRFSPLGYLGEGIISLTASGLVCIGDIRDDIRTLPIIFSAILERKAKYCSAIDSFRQTSSKYVLSSSINSLIVVPICSESFVSGYIISTEVPKNAAFDERLVNALTHYGQLVGKALEKTKGAMDSQHLSKRELEVMKKVAWGESTKEMAQSMHLSEVTVKQYVNSAIKKLNAKNRSHAVAELFRKGILH
ncbi:LuxR C-terminal-related transcriptional regulator [Brevibacillus fulvus]|uniref:DNA-binding NarL/FixJ family response regulator n=1 Tax=Brevibacillus fulvus TaxID=1125967 RepID=A0A939BSA5_9BACL|nr:DNA-binding NarL/FixJ family response regulator [Brevibacillus fulvus]